MKENEVPEKIYLIRNFPRTTSLNTTNDYHGKYLQEWYESREKEADIEYTRTDAFIEKACSWLKENKDKYLYNTGEKGEYIPTCSGKMIDEFRKHMKGE